MKNLIVTHRSDVDGILAGALLARYLRVNVELIFCTYSEQQQVFSLLANLEPGRKIFVSDISAKDFLLPDKTGTVLGQIAERAERLEWYDHHSNTEDFASLIRMCGRHKVVMGVKEKICATEVIRRSLLPDDNYANFLGRIAQAHDYPELAGLDEEAIRAGLYLQKIISLYNVKGDIKICANLLRWIAKNDSWYQGGNFHPRLREVIAGFKAMAGQAKAEALKNRITLEIKGRKFVIACADPILPEKETLAGLRDEFAGKVDGVAVYFLPPISQAVGNILFYKDARSDFNARKFCEFMGGGGREDKGGFSPPAKFSREEFGSLVVILAKKLAEFI